MKSPRVVIEPPRTDSRIFAHTRWDVIPVCAALLHCAFFFALFYLFPRVPLWVMLILGLIYSVSISWNINGISHNFIHTPYFRLPLLNRSFSILESVTVGFSQIFYECIHMQHNKGNADRPDWTQMEALRAQIIDLQRVAGAQGNQTAARARFSGCQFAQRQTEMPGSVRWFRSAAGRFRKLRPLFPFVRL